MLRAPSGTQLQEVLEARRGLAPAMGGHDAGH